MINFFLLPCFDSEGKSRKHKQKQTKVTQFFDKRYNCIAIDKGFQPRSLSALFFFSLWFNKNNYEYDNNRTLIITTILIMITIVIHWNVIGGLAALFSQIILYSCNRTDTFRPNISGWDNVWRKKILHYGNYPFFFRMSGCCYGYCDQLCKCSASICIAKKNFVPSVFAFFQSIIRDG